jgi:hypothetical protein
MAGILRTKPALFQITVVLVGLGILVSGCTSNDSPRSQVQEKGRRPLARETSVSDGQGTSDPGQLPSNELKVQAVSDVSSSPREELNGIEGVRVEPSSPITGDQVTARVTLASSFQQPVELVYKWKRNGQPVQVSQSEVLQIPLKRDDFVEVEVSMARNDEGPPRGVTGSVMVGNAPPTMRLANQTIGNDGSYQAKIESSDPEGDNFTLSIKEGPPGMSIDPGGNIRWAGDSKAEGSFSVAVSARDVHGAETSLNYQIKIHRETDGKAS